MVTTKSRGDEAEDQALAHLQAQGLRLVERNYRVAHGPSARGAEVDLIMQDTDGTLGQQVIANFTIVNSSDPAGSITVVPEKATITGAFVNVCTTGFQIDYFIYGGKPPYRVSSTFPQAGRRAGR